MDGCNEVAVDEYRNLKRAGFGKKSGVCIMSWLHVKYNYFKIISAFVDVDWKNFISVRGNLPEIISKFRSLMELVNIFQHV